MNIEKMSIKEKEQLVNNSGLLMHKASLKEYKQALFFALYKNLNETFSDMYVEVGTYYYNKMKEHINEQATKMYEKFLDRIINNYVINTKKEIESIDQRHDDFKHFGYTGEIFTLTKKEINVLNEIVSESMQEKLNEYLSQKKITSMQYMHITKALIDKTFYTI